MSVSVSESIGKLLLEGYKMLADSCEVCCTVLMQDRRGRVICVQCESASMANSVHADVRPSGKMANGNSNSNSHEENTVMPTTLVNGLNNPANRDTDNSSNSALESSEKVLMKEMQNATTTLQNLSLHHHDLQAKLLYVRYIKECAETIQALRGIKKT